MNKNLIDDMYKNKIYLNIMFSFKQMILLMQDINISYFIEKWNNNECLHKILNVFKVFGILLQIQY